MQALLVCCLAVSTLSQTVLPIPNGSFEEGLTDWSIPANEGMCSLSTDQAASGKQSLRVADASDKAGSSATSRRVAITGGQAYELHGKVFPVSGTGLGMYVRVLDRDGQLAEPGDAHQMGLGGTDNKWKSFSLTIYTPDEAAFLEVWIHSYAAAIVTAYLDDLEFVALGDAGRKPPWQGQYKIRAPEANRLTPADIVGPDGIVYPNWTRCGVQGGIPHVPERLRIEDFGGKADDDADDATALEQACAAAGEAGGGAVVLGAGTYYLDRPVAVRKDGVVIRGQGPDKTRLLFRYRLPESGVAFYALAPGAHIGPGSRVELHCRPTGLRKMTILAGETVVGAWQPGEHSGNTFSFGVSGRDVLAKAPTGDCLLKGVAEWRDGKMASAELPVVLDPAYRELAPVAPSSAAITFLGQGYTGPKLELAQDGKRGSLTLELKSVQGLQPGDCLLIDGPATERWKRLTRNACQWGTYRRYQVAIEKVEGNTITLAQPLRIEFPVVDGSTVQKIVPLRRCGLEDLYIEQTENLWITTAMFRFGWDCWARNVRVRKCGRFPVYGSEAKFCEIRDCVFDDAWFKGGGGTAYCGWEGSYDCLLDGIETFRLRHAPLFQWAASGCVIRNGVFHESDGQWHSGWTNENLMENCVIDAKTGNGAYGFGMWASPPEDTAHGPNGPRNVVYNCDVSSPKAGLWMGGMNENWLILYNRFIVESGQGIFAKTASFDHIIRGNVFVLKDGKSPMVSLATPDCVGVELIANKLYGGNGKLVSGPGKPALMESNEVLPLEEAARPVPPVPSIYEWELEQAREQR